MPHFTEFIVLWAEAGAVQPANLTSAILHVSPCALCVVFAPGLLPVRGKQVYSECFVANSGFETCVFFPVLVNYPSICAVVAI